MEHRSRYEEWLLDEGSPAAVAVAEASTRARAAVTVTAQKERAIRDVAAGVAAPALCAFVHWVIEQAHEQGLRRLCFVARHGQVLYQIARRSGRLGTIKVEYVYGSRRTWRLATSQVEALGDESWLFDSFINSNAADLCDRLGLDFREYRAVLEFAGVSLEPEVRADNPFQMEAMRRFLGEEMVKKAVGARIQAMRTAVQALIAQHSLGSATTGIVDAGWSGAMMSSLLQLVGDAGLQTPQIFYWGYAPSAMSSLPTDCVNGFMYNTARHDADYRMVDTTFVIETFCMSDHGIVSGYDLGLDGTITPELSTTDNPAVAHWGLDTYRQTIYAYCDAWRTNGGLSVPRDVVRPLVQRLVEEFWTQPTSGEAAAWSSYPYDSDPTASAVRPLARPWSVQEIIRGIDHPERTRGQRAWVGGSLQLSSLQVRGLVRSLGRRSVGALMSG